MTAFSLSELEFKIRTWGHERNIISGLTPKDQLPKLVEELGELGGAIARGKREVFIDSIGDIIVVLTLMAAMEDTSLQEALNHAWNEIKDRRGIVRDGIFIKEQDLHND